VLGHPFIGSEGEQDGRTGRGIRWPDGVAVVVAEWSHHSGRFILECGGNDEWGGEAARCPLQGGEGTDGEARGRWKPKAQEEWGEQAGRRLRPRRLG
jgi:hypothetical protein